MSGAEFVLFLFFVALVSFASILRKRLTGAHKKGGPAGKRESASQSGEPEDVAERAPHGRHGKKQATAGKALKMLMQRLEELADGRHPERQETASNVTLPTPPEKPRRKHRAEPPRRQAPTAPDIEPPAIDAATAKAAAPELSRQGGAARLRRALGSHESIRVAMIMKEVLDKPVAMRGAPGRRRPAR